MSKTAKPNTFPFMTATGELVFRASHHAMAMDAMAAELAGERCGSLDLMVEVSNGIMVAARENAAGIYQGAALFCGA